jgi:hypothetical protein
MFYRGIRTQRRTTSTTTCRVCIRKLSVLTNATRHGFIKRFSPCITLYIGLANIRMIGQHLLCTKEHLQIFKHWDGVMDRTTTVYTASRRAGTAGSDQFQKYHSTTIDFNATVLECDNLHRSNYIVLMIPNQTPGPPIIQSLCSMYAALKIGRTCTSFKLAWWLCVVLHVISFPLCRRAQLP